MDALRISICERLAKLRGSVGESPEALEEIRLLEEALETAEDAALETRRKVERLSANLEALDARLVALEQSRAFRALRRAGSLWKVWRERWHRSFPPSDQSYRAWVAREERATPDAGTLDKLASQFRYRPRFGLTLARADHQRRGLRESLGSLSEQAWQNWRLCVGPEGAACEEQDPRIQSVSPSGWSLRRIAEATGSDYLALLGAGDLLPPHALHYLAAALQRGEADILYSDEDRIDAAGNRCAPVFKPAWSREMVSSGGFPGNLLAIRRGALDGFEGDERELLPRLLNRSVNALHVPRVLYHRRGLVPQDPPAGFPPCGNSARPPVSVVICSRSAGLMRRCLRALRERTEYGPLEVVVVQHGTEAVAAMRPILDGCVGVVYEGPFDFAAMNNRGAAAASGELLVFMNDDVQPRFPGWLGALAARLASPGIGVAGARLLYPSGAIQHAGVAVGITDGAGHPGRGSFQTPYWPWAETAREVTAVTGACLAIPAAVFRELGGFDPAFPVNYNDVDLCLRARRAGYRVIYEPAAVLVHKESSTRIPGTRYRERELFYERWGAALHRCDPFYNPNLTRLREDASLRLDTEPDWADGLLAR